MAHVLAFLLFGLLILGILAIITWLAVFCAGLFGISLPFWPTLLAVFVIRLVLGNISVKSS